MTSHQRVRPYDRMLGCTSGEMFEQPSCPALIPSDDEDDETEKGQRQQEAGEDSEQRLGNSDTSSNGDVNNDDNHLQDNDESEGLQPTKQRRLSPSCDPAIRRSRKGRIQHFDKGVSTTRPTQRQHRQEIAEETEQEGHDIDHDHRDDQDSDDSGCLRLAKRCRPSPSFNNPISERSRKQRLQRPHRSCSKNPSKLARADLVSVRKETQQLSPSVSDDSDRSDCSEAPRPVKWRRSSSSNCDPTSNGSQKWRLQRPSRSRSRTPSMLDRSHTASPQTQLKLSPIPAQL